MATIDAGIFLGKNGEKSRVKGESPGLGSDRKVAGGYGGSFGGQGWYGVRGSRL